MPIQFLMMLFLSALAQAQEELEQLPDAPTGRRVVITMRIVVRFETRELTVSWSSIPGDDGAPVQQVAKRLNLNAAVVEPENFDRWLFEDAGFETPPQQHLDDVLQTEIGTAVRQYGLTAEQRLKLRLAGKGDVKRFSDQVEERRGRFDKERQNYQSGLAALKGLNDLSLIYTEGPFG